MAVGQSQRLILVWEPLAGTVLSSSPPQILRLPRAELKSKGLVPLQYNIAPRTTGVYCTVVTVLYNVTALAVGQSQWLYSGAGVRICTGYYYHLSSYKKK